MWLCCSLVVTLITSIPDTFVLWLNVYSQITLITGILYTFMLLYVRCLHSSSFSSDDLNKHAMSNYTFYVAWWNKNINKENNCLTLCHFWQAVCLVLEGLSGNIRPKFDPGNHIFKVGKLYLLVTKQRLTMRNRSLNMMKISNVSFIWHLDQDHRLDVDLPGEQRTWPPNFIIIIQLFLLILCYTK